MFLENIFPFMTSLSPPSVLFTTVLILFIICLVSRGVYNLYFHPLRHFPGPKLGALTDFFKLWIISTKQIHTLGLWAHERWGPVVRVAPNLLVANDPLLLPQIYHRHADKTDLYTSGFLGETAPGFQTLGWREHMKKRKRVAGAYALSNLVKMEDRVDERIQEFCAALTERFANTGENIDFAKWSQWFSYDTISQLAFGEPIGFIRGATDVSDLIKNFHDMAPFAAVVGALPWLCAPFLNNPLTKRYLMPKPGDKTGIGKVMSFRDALLRTRFENPQARHQGDFLDIIFNSTNEDGSAMTLEEIKVECLVFMVAGSDTTASTVCAFVRYVLETPGVYHRLITEVDEWDARGMLEHPVPKFETIMKMPYFTACHRETLRLYPPTQVNIPRYVSEGGLHIDGAFVPAGTEIGANPYIINRDKGIFGEDADSFRPDRWLQDADRVAHMDKYILSWGYGARVCQGKHIAQLETYKYLLQLFRVFKPTIANPGQVWEEANLAMMVQWNFWLKLEHRKNFRDF
ncbi:Cytochrome P450 monooxygenase [Paramyrothecium foliicola]|nr:Cytochrome P450 monooxygenase [Paramyrothecium foliicola]